MAKIDTLSMTKTAEKPYPLVTYIAHMREYPPPGGLSAVSNSPMLIWHKLLEAWLAQCQLPLKHIGFATS